MVANGARLAIGMPGMHNLAIYDALRLQPMLRHILIRNEQGASTMANAELCRPAYAEATVSSFILSSSNSTPSPGPSGGYR